MIKWLIKILWGDDCKHDYEIVKQNETLYNTRILFKCKKCGRFKKKKI